MHCFYTPDIDGKFYILNEEESKHCTRVLRLLVGDLIYLIDGGGGFYTAKIIEISAKRCEVEIVDVKHDFEQRDYKLHIAIAPTKNIDRFEWFLEKTTEIGIDEITPLVCEHSERRTIKKERAEKVVVAAVKQSIKAYVPKVNDIADFKSFVAQKFDGKKFIAHCDEGEKILLQKLISPTENAIVLIGPEGDFSSTEIELARQNGFEEISLGNSRLRTETAGVYACALVSFING